MIRKHAIHLYLNVHKTMEIANWTQSGLALSRVVERVVTSGVDSKVSSQGFNPHQSRTSIRYIARARQNILGPNLDSISFRAKREFVQIVLRCRVVFDRVFY